MHSIEGSLEVKLPTIWRDEAAEVGRVREEKGRRKKTSDEKESEERRSRCFFQLMFCGSGGWKSRLAKAACAKPSCSLRDEQVHAIK